MNLARLMRSHVEFFRYCLVGGLAFILDTLLFFALIRLLGIPYSIAALFSFLLGISVNYMLSLKWVFRVETKYSSSAFVAFLSIGIVGIGIMEFILWYGIEIWGLNALIMKILSATIVLIWNYSARKVLVFKTPLLQNE